ncbi:Hypothetical predicted protein [Scomber scombrus]|uniref:Uncharacterized protein n=1 Tax=Scomber scombrus TaxID=13677 RepID=A0AAV1N6Z5_SCOSC
MDVWMLEHTCGKQEVFGYEGLRPCGLLLHIYKSPGTHPGVSALSQSGKAEDIRGPSVCCSPFILPIIPHQARMTL